jgi:serine O-acetyltransferase
MPEVSPEFVSRLQRARSKHQVPTHVRALSKAFADLTLGVLFPHYAADVGCGAHAVIDDVLQVRDALSRILRSISPLYPGGPEHVPERFVEALPGILDRLEEDAQAIFEGDPAASGLDEVILTYPGFYAIAVYRVAHALHELGVPLVPRLLTEHAHEKTGVDIHPGARIGRRFCIDHGTGVVVGETTVIGHGVKLYQGVTLGALTVQKVLAGRKRHPTIDDDVVVYAGATILGGETVVGRGSVVAGNAFVTRSVPPGSIVGRSGEVRTRGGVSPEELDFVI